MEGNTVMLVNLNHTLNHTLTLTLTLLPQSVIALIVDKVYNLLLEEEEDGNHTNLTHQSLSQLLLPLRGVCWHWKRAMDDLWFKLKLLNLYDQLLVPLVHPPDDNNNNNANLPVSPWFFRFFFNGKTARNWAAGLDHFCIRTRAVVGVRDCITSLQMDCDRIVVGTRRHKLVALDLETLSPFLATNFNHNIHNHPILTLAFDTHHSNSNILVSGDQLGKLVVWNSLSGQVLGWRDECHSGGISCTAVISSPDIIIVTAGFDKFIRIHQVVKEEEANPTASLQFNQLHINGKDRRSSFSSSTSSSTSKSFLSATTTKTPPSLSPHSSLHSFPSASLSAPTSPFPVRNNNTISTSSLWSTQSSPRKSAFLNRGGSLHRSASIDRNRMAVVASSNETVFVSSSSSPQIISPTSNNKLLSKITKSLKKKSKKLKNKVKRKLFQMSPQKKTAAGNNDTTAAVSTSQNTTSIQPAIALECIQELRGHIGDIYHICILRKEGDHPHGHFLASASLDHSIKIWNTSESQCLRTLRAHRDSVSSLCSLGETLFSAGMDGMVIQWNWMTGSVLRVFPSSPLSSSQSCWVRSIAVRGEYLVCGDSIGYISVWNWKTSDSACYRIHLDRGPVTCLQVDFRRIVAVCREEGHANEVVVVDFAPQTVPSAAAAKGALETTSDSVPEQLQQRLE